MEIKVVESLKTVRRYHLPFRIMIQTLFLSLIHSLLSFSFKFALLFSIFFSLSLIFTSQISVFHRFFCTLFKMQFFFFFDQATHDVIVSLFVIEYYRWCYHDISYYCCCCCYGQHRTGYCCSFDEM